jgi:hypothetical protein
MLGLCYEMAQLMEAALAVADDCSLCWPRHHTVSGFLALSIELIRAIIYFFLSNTLEELRIYHCIKE